MQNETSEMLVCFALKEEAAPFRKMATGKPGVSILIAGVGRKNAEKSLREFLAGGASVPASRSQADSPDQARLVKTLAPPSLVLTCGFAGGLNPDLKSGDVVFELSNLHPPSLGTAKRSEEGSILHLQAKLPAAGAKPAKFLCADRIATTATEKKKLRENTGTDAVDMESEAIHAVCREHGIPCATVRVILDASNEDLPLDFNALLKSDMSLDYGKLLLAITKAPGKIKGLLKLQEQTRFAAERLADVLEKIVFH